MLNSFSSRIVSVYAAETPIYLTGTLTRLQGQDSGIASGRNQNAMRVVRPTRAQCNFSRVFDVNMWALVSSCGAGWAVLKKVDLYMGEQHFTQHSCNVHVSAKAGIFFN